MDLLMESRLEDFRPQSALAVAFSGGEHHLLRSSSTMCRTNLQCADKFQSPELEGSQPSLPAGGT